VSSVLSCPSERPHRDQAPPGHQRLRLLVAYDGSCFDGWQSQLHRRTVQDALEQAFASLLGGRVPVHGSGRTDSGVHATGQVAHADVPSGRLSSEHWAGALNARLDPAVRIVRATRAPRGFHARFSASGKLYTYRIWNDRVLRPTERARAWHTPVPIDRTLLRTAARLLEGRHDFAPFSAKRANQTDTVRHLRRIGIQSSGPLLTLHFEGDGFLYRMVRLLVGSLVRVAQSKAPMDWIQQFLLHPGGPRSSFCAEPQGLYLTRVFYPRNLRTLSSHLSERFTAEEP
jgi:tRNA pseudouridine38-40 synthase